MTLFSETLSGDQLNEIGQTVKRTLAYFADNEIVEVRIMTNTPDLGVMSGYFADPVSMSQQIVAYYGSFNIYLTVNPINHECLVGKNPIDNRLHPRTKITTKDSDILSRRWFLLDFDPKRQNGDPHCSSTAREHQIAINIAKRCKDWLCAQGFTEPILASSGNGAHLMFKIDLPNNAESTTLIAQCLGVIHERYKSEPVDVDLAVGNASRIWKCYGTRAMKGTSTPERPHRDAYILTAPEPQDIHITPRTCLEALAALAPQAPPSPTPGAARVKQILAQSKPSGSFDTQSWLEQWIAESGLEVASTAPWNGGTIWHLTSCPYEDYFNNTDHRHPKKAYITRTERGISAGCQSANCQQLYEDRGGWYTLRDIVEPGWEDKRQQQQSPLSSVEQEALDTLMTTICETKKTALIFENIETFARLPKEELYKVQARFQDAFKAQFKKKDFENAIKEKKRALNAPQNPPTGETPDDTSDAYPTIITNRGQLRDYAQSTLHVLEQCSQYYERGTVLVRIRHDHEGEPFVEEMTKDALQSALTDHMNFYRVKMEEEGEEYTDVEPPASVAQYIYTTPERAFRQLYGITRIPVLRPDGTILDEPGYDPQTKLLYSPDPVFANLQLPEHPTQEDAKKAAQYVRKLLCDFPFVDNASTANMLALILTSVVRSAIPGCVPMALIDAPQPGSGKGLLAKLVFRIATGKHAEMEIFPRDNDEMRKKISTILVSSRPLVCFDNVESTIYHEALASVLTADRWSDRLLGTNKRINMPNRAVWIATGNNIQLGGDIPRRCYLIRINPASGRPEDRAGFKYTDLEHTVLRARMPIILQLLIWAKAWVLAGKPAGGLRLGSFEDWASTIGGMLKFAGVEGFLENRHVLYDERDTQGDEWRAFLRKWRGIFGSEFVWLREVIKSIEQDEDFNETLPLSVLQAFKKYDDTAQKSKFLGKILSGIIERRYGDLYMLQDKKDNTNKPATWAVWSDSEPNNETRHSIAIRAIKERLDRAQPGQ